MDKDGSDDTINSKEVEREGDRLMSQEGIMKILSKNKKKWFDSDELSKKLKISKGSVTENLKNLRRFGMVETNFERPPYKPRYKWKR